MNNAIAAMVFLVVLLLLGTPKHQKVRRVLAGGNITYLLHRLAVQVMGMNFQGGVLLLGVLNKLGISWEQADKRNYSRIHGWVPISRYGNSTPVPIEHRFEEQPKTRNETEISETKSRYGDSLGAWAIDGTDELAANAGCTSYQDYHDIPPSLAPSLKLLYVDRPIWTPSLELVELPACAGRLAKKSGLALRSPNGCA